MSIQRHNNKSLQGFLFPLLTEFPQSSHKNGPHNIKIKNSGSNFSKVHPFLYPCCKIIRFFSFNYNTIFCFFLSSHSFFSEVTLFHYILHMPSSLCNERGPISLISYINTNETDKVSYSLCLSRKAENAQNNVYNSPLLLYSSINKRVLVLVNLFRMFSLDVSETERYSYNILLFMFM